MDAIGRAIVLVLDGVGVGALPDAAEYGDEGSDTLGNVARALKGLTLPNLQRWGLGNLHEIAGVGTEPQPVASYGKMSEISPGKDSTSGHWELMGCPVEAPFPTYPDGFPPEVTRIVAEVAGSPPLGNVVSSGTEIIEELGSEHLRTGRPILYTSADSVLQLAVHTKVWPTDKLYAVCTAVRERLLPPHQVARVIARPFFGDPGTFVRTQERKDFTVPPVKTTLLDLLKEAGHPVVGIGKIDDLFGGRGLTASRPAKGLDICLEEILAVMEITHTGLVLANLGDFDTLWGHRNDVAGFGNGLLQFDTWLLAFEALLRPGHDVAIITADHGCDPTTPSTDHSREYVPLLVWSGGTPGVELGVRASFADVAATIGAFLGVSANLPGSSFLADLPPPLAYDTPTEPGCHDLPPADSESPPAGEDVPGKGFLPLDGILPTGTDSVGHGEEIAQLVREIQEELPFGGNLFVTVLHQEGQIPVELLTRLGSLEREHGAFIGVRLVTDGTLSHDELTEFLNLALGRWLDQAGLLSGEVRRVFEGRQKSTFAGEDLLDEGLLSEEQLAAFYVRSCGIPYIQLSGYRVPKEASGIVPREAAVAGGVLPIAKEGDLITVATSRPADSRLVEEVASWTGCQVRTVLAMRAQLMEALGSVYAHSDADAPQALPQDAPEPSAADAPDSGSIPGSSDAATTLSESFENIEMAWLLHAAKAMTKNAYAPHSGLKVGAAVLADNGEVFAGCNVENDSFGLSMCAERIAIFKAISSGRRRIKAIAVVADGLRGIKPCGACLQVVRQFGPDAVLIFESETGGAETKTLAQLLPYAFTLPEGKAE
ncbi:phosphopentomutase [Candidatus Fermentibacteria bacterium]|nr:phosphopentomutase [Candidatus Fermentibacteria bacterium]